MPWTAPRSHGERALFLRRVSHQGRDRMVGEVARRPYFDPRDAKWGPRRLTSRRGQSQAQSSVLHPSPFRGASDARRSRAHRELLLAIAGCNDILGIRTLDDRADAASAATVPGSDATVAAVPGSDVTLPVDAPGAEAAGDDRSERGRCGPRRPERCRRRRERRGGRALRRLPAPQAVAGPTGSATSTKTHPRAGNRRRRAPRARRRRPAPAGLAPTSAPPPTARPGAAIPREAAPLRRATPSAARTGRPAAGARG